MNGGQNIGVIGLGIMGGSIARHLIAAGKTVYGRDPDLEAAAAAALDGVKVVGSIAELVCHTDLLISSLPTLDALLRVAADLEAATAPCTVVEMSTLCLADKLLVRRVLQPSDHIVLDCPISGTGAQMATGDVAIYASGPAAAVADALPLLACFSRKQINLGAFGNGTRAKLIANLLVAINNVATAEALGLAEAASIPPELMIEAISAGAGNSRIFELRAPMIASGRFEPATMKLSVWAKDMAAIADFVAEVDRPTPLFDAVEPLYAAVLAMGNGQLDTAAVALALESNRSRKRGR